MNTGIADCGGSESQVASQPRKPRVAGCDVLTMWSHIHYRGDVFVMSNSQDFLRESRVAALQELGVSRLMKPTDAVGLLG
jgi:hypothetical protein